MRNGGTLVEQGQKISNGQVIGEVGNTGVGTGPHLHFEIYQGVKNSNDVLQPAMRKNIAIDPTSIPDLQIHIFGQQQINWLPFDFFKAQPDNTEVITPRPVYENKPYERY